MWKTRRCSAAGSDKYQQTDISIYFKVKNKFSTIVTMNPEQHSTNKENGTEKSTIPLHKKPNSLFSGDESEATDFMEITPSKSLPSLVNGNILREHQLQLPIQIPSYTYSEDSDSDIHRDDSKIAQQRNRTTRVRHTEHQRKKSSEAAASVRSNKKDGEIGSTLKRNATQPIIVVSSDEEDFVVTPKKFKKVEKSANKTTAHSKTRKKLSLSRRDISDNKEAKKNVEDAQAASSEIALLLNGPSTSKATLENSVIPIGVHKPTIVTTTIVKQKPQILQAKSNSGSYLPSTTAELISTDFKSGGLEVPSTSFHSNDPNATLIYEGSINFAVTEAINATPTKSVTVVKNFIISKPSKSQDTLEECNLGPIKDTRTDKAASQNNTSSLNFNEKTEFVKNEDDIEGHLTLKFFTHIVKYVKSHSHLKTMLSDTEVTMLEQFLSMEPVEYRFLCFKLYTRIQKWYNIFKLRDILKMTLSDPEVREMYDCLVENRFVEVDFSSEPCIELLDILLCKQVKDICESFKMKITSERKPELIQRLLKNCNRQTTLTFTKSTKEILRDRITEKMGICVKLSPALYKLFSKLYLLYTFTTSDFGTTNDLHFYLSKIVKKDIIMPTFTVNMNIEIFSSIEEFERFSEAYECKRAIIQAFEKKELDLMFELTELARAKLEDIMENCEVQKPSYLMRFTAGYKYATALSLGAKHLARHHPEKAENWLIYLIYQDQYCSMMRGFWYDLLIMVQYVYLKQHETAADTLIEALERKDLLDVHMYELSYRAEAVKRSKSHKISELKHNQICFVQPAPLREFPFIEIDARAIRDEFGRKGKRLYMEKTEGEKHLYTVEEIAQKHYHKHDFINSLHCEGSLLETIFFVLFWDIIYESDNVPDAFILEIQYFPLDLMSPEFYTNRKAEIENRLDEIRFKWPVDQLKNFICVVWEKHSHEKSYINDTLVDNPEQLYDIILCIGRLKLAQMLERISKNFKAYHSGLPDLFLWNVKQRKCKFVEVKGEKDKLSTKQKLWLDFLLSVGADAEVCHVHTIGSKTGRKIKSEMKKEKKTSLNKSDKTS